MSKILGITVLVCLLAISLAFNVRNNSKIKSLDGQISLLVYEMMLTKTVVVSLQNTNSNTFQILFTGEVEAVGKLVKAKQDETLSNLGEEAIELGSKMEKVDALEALKTLGNEQKQH